MNHSPSNIIPFQRPSPVVASPPDTAARQATEALYMLMYLRDLLTTEPGLRKRSRTRLHDLAADSAHLLDAGLRGMGGAAMTRPTVPDPRELCRAVEDLRCTHLPLVMAADGIAATLHHVGKDAHAGLRTARVAEPLRFHLADDLAHRPRVNKIGVRFTFSRQ